MSTLYRLYLGLHDRNSDPVSPEIKLAFVLRVGSFFPGFTVIAANGWWERNSEPSMIFEILASPADRETVHALATEYRDKAKQSAVLMTESQVKSVLI